MKGKKKLGILLSSRNVVLLLLFIVISVFWHFVIQDTSAKEKQECKMQLYSGTKH